MASSEFVVRPVARIRSDFASKFGIPKQSGLVPALTAKVVFEPEFRSPDALRGIEGYSHLWLLWQFSGLPGWAGTCAWACSPAAHRSARTASACPAWSWSGSIPTIPRGPC